MSADRANRTDLLERVASYRELAEISQLAGLPELTRHAEKLAQKYQAELDALGPLKKVSEISDTYFVPTDPADATNCEACQ